MSKLIDKRALHRRLARAIGQLQAVDRMIDDDVPCEELLIQLAAANSAVKNAAGFLLEEHIRHCVRDGIEHGDADRTIDDFTAAMKLFTNFK